VIKEDFPEEGEFVVCTVKEVKDFGAIVTLDEYGDKEGFIHIAEIASGWVKYIRDHVREGQKIVCKVLRADPNRKRIDLSLKQVNEHQRREKIQQWKNEKKAEKLFELFAERAGMPLQECYEKIGKDLLKVFGSLYNAFEQCAINPDVLEEEGMSGEWIKVFIEIARENIVPPYVRIKRGFEITCYKPDGVLKIKDALEKGENVKIKGVDVKIRYVGAPRYEVVITAPEYKTGERAYKEVVKKITENITSAGGSVKFV